MSQGKIRFKRLGSGRKSKNAPYAYRMHIERFMSGIALLVHKSAEIIRVVLRLCTGDMGSYKGGRAENRIESVFMHGSLPFQASWITTFSHFL